MVGNGNDLYDQKTSCNFMAGERHHLATNYHQDEQ